MDINSIIEAIKQSIITDTPADVQITDKSFFAELLGNNNNENDSSQEKQKFIYKPHFNKEKCFPITHYIFQCLWCIITFIIYLFYFLSSKTLEVLTGEKRDLRKSARFNAILFIACITSYIVIFAFSFTFLIKSVLFFDTDNRINSQGTIMMKQPLGVEQYVYLFNTATLWANTGIEILENDKVEISASGSFYGKISDLYKKAKYNDTLKYPWNSPRFIRQNNKESSKINNKKSRLEDLCIYKAPDAYFGSLLFQICPEKTNCLIHRKTAPHSRNRTKVPVPTKKRKTR